MNIKIFDGTFEFENGVQLDEFLNSMNNEMALKIIQVAIMHAQERGLFSLEESHTLYKCFQEMRDNDD
jgi:hypothetical protein